MERRPAVIALALILSILTLLLLAGHGPWSGHLILEFDDDHGVNSGDLIIAPLWLAGMACCAWLWRR